VAILGNLRDSPIMEVITVINRSNNGEDKIIKKLMKYDEISKGDIREFIRETSYDAVLRYYEQIDHFVEYRQKNGDIEGRLVEDINIKEWSVISKVPSSLTKEDIQMGFENAVSKEMENNRRKLLQSGISKVDGKHYRRSISTRTQASMVGVTFGLDYCDCDEVEEVLNEAKKMPHKKMIGKV